MKNIFNSIGISQRCRGQIKDDTVENLDIISYDLVSNPGIDFSSINELHRQALEELKRQQLLKDRKEKLKKLNNL